MKKIIMLISFVTLWACNDYLDIIPDDIATINSAFTLRKNAERYLFTCYSWLPSQGSLGQNPAFIAGHELWPVPTSGNSSFSIAKGLQNADAPEVNFWDKESLKGGKSMYQAIRDCNIFLENIQKVPDLDATERSQWISEVKFLKAYYHFWLFRMYGPIPIVDTNLAIDASTEEVKVSRKTVDEVVTYLVTLLDEAASGLPLILDSPITQAGRITKPIAMAIKAKVLTLAASPLFNGNTQYSQMLSKEGTPLINQSYDLGKWQLAADACKEAIDAAHQAGNSLYTYVQENALYKLSDTTRIQMNIRNVVAKRWNSEAIWSNTGSLFNQASVTPRTWDPSNSISSVYGGFAPTLKLVETFYSDKGVPINEDVTYDYANRYKLKTAGEDDKYNIKKGIKTAYLNFNRENRYYATLGFDGGVWYGQGRYNDDDPWVIYNKNGEAAGIIVTSAFSQTGYWPKKLINYNNVINTTSYTTEWYPWPVVRLGDLYLLYAEALNEVGGPTTEVYTYLNLIRERAGLDTVENSWTNYSNNPNKFTTQDGLREIIHQERMVELALEGKIYWDLRRWKKAHIFLNLPVQGWTIKGETDDTYYRIRTIDQPVFNQRDYLWPISDSSILRNENLIQNSGW